MLVNLHCIECAGSPPNTGNTSVIVSINDTNDVAPRFTSPFGYVFSVFEDARVGSVISSEVQANKIAQ